MTDWPDAKRVNKPCESCGEMMEEVPVKRKICTKCSKERDNETKRQRRDALKNEKAATVAPEKLDSDQPAAF